PRGAQAGTAAVSLYELRVALETDWQYYEVFGDAGAAATYALSLFGAVSDAYRRDVDTVVTVPYLGLYTSNNDPWDAQDFGFGSIDVLYEFQDTWKTTGWPVEADLAHLISGAGLGGGVAWLDVLCVADYGYAVSGNLHGGTPFPVAQGPLNWDFVVTAHETGHNVVTHHTHNYCPPIDECAPEGYWGPCQDEVVCVEGTIMSYCHICNELGMANVRPEFHPIVQDALRARVEDSCLQPFSGIFATDLGQGLAGSGPAPELGIAWVDAPGPAGAVEVEFDGAPHPQVGVLVVGGSQIDLALFGGVLVPSPDLLKAFPAGAAHVDLAPFAIAGGFPGGAVAYAQGWFTDPGGPEGLVASNALEVELHAPDAPAPLAWIAHPTNGLEYAVGPAKTWLASRGLAEQHGGDLAALSSSALEAWLKTTFFDGGLVAGDVHIGYTDMFTEGAYHWTSGAGGSYSHWAPNEPNDYDGFEDCAVWVGGGTWNDTHGYDALQALYQRPVGTQP
ncbi:MAG TPA: M12 family metallo-peptidase, partial [Planctomycetota bacterium]|nr:M12 family metallo-peptidase [Planctomycetota bacterium]